MVQTSLLLVKNVKVSGYYLSGSKEISTRFTRLTRLFQIRKKKCESFYMYPFKKYFEFGYLGDKFSRCSINKDWLVETVVCNLHCSVTKPPEYTFGKCLYETPLSIFSKFAYSIITITTWELLGKV